MAAKQHIRLSSSLHPGESLYGYRICIQAILQDKPKIVTSNLGKVSSGGWGHHGAGGQAESTKLLGTVKALETPRVQCQEATVSAVYTPAWRVRGQTPLLSQFIDRKQVIGALSNLEPGGQSGGKYGWRPLSGARVRVWCPTVPGLPLLTRLTPHLVPGFSPCHSVPYLPTCPPPHCSQFLELLRSHQSRPAKCLTIMWAMGQAGFSSLPEGLKGNGSRRGGVGALSLSAASVPGLRPTPCPFLQCGWGSCSPCWASSLCHPSPLPTWTGCFCEWCGAPGSGRWDAGLHRLWKIGISCSSLSWAF